MRAFCCVVVGVLCFLGFGLSIIFQRLYAPGDGLWVGLILGFWFWVAWTTFRWIRTFRKKVPEPTGSRGERGSRNNAPSTRKILESLSVWGATEAKSFVEKIPTKSGANSYNVFGEEFDNYNEALERAARIVKSRNRNRR